MYRNVSSLIKACDELNLPIWELMIRSEMKYARATRQEVWDKMKNQLQVMEMQLTEVQTETESILRPD